MRFTLFLISLSGFIGQAQLSVAGNHLICPDHELILFAQGDSNYSWAMADDPDDIIWIGLYLAFVPTDTTSVILYSENDTLVVPIISGGSQCICKVFVPNVFTPDGDLFNDTFEPIVNCGEIQGVRLTVCNRMGKVVFDETHYEWVEWDGTDSENGQIVSDGLYGWQLSYINQKGETIHHMGHVFVLR